MVPRDANTESGGSLTEIWLDSITAMPLKDESATEHTHKTTNRYIPEIEISKSLMYLLSCTSIPENGNLCENITYTKLNEKKNSRMHERLHHKVKVPLPRWSSGWSGTPCLLMPELLRFQRSKELDKSVILQTYATRTQIPSIHRPEEKLHYCLQVS